MNRFHAERSMSGRFANLLNKFNGPLLGYELFLSRLPVGGAKLAIPIVATVCALPAPAHHGSGVPALVARSSAMQASCGRAWHPLRDRARAIAFLARKRAIEKIAAARSEAGQSNVTDRTALEGHPTNHGVVLDKSSPL